MLWRLFENFMLKQPVENVVILDFSKNYKAQANFISCAFKTLARPKGYKLVCDYVIESVDVDVTKWTIWTPWHRYLALIEMLRTNGYDLVYNPDINAAEVVEYEEES